MPISVASAQDFFFEVSDVSDNAFTFLDSSATNFQITVNRVNQSNGTNDFVSSKFLTANSDGSLPKTQVKIDIPAGTTDHNAYFDASFSVVVTSFNSSMVVVRSEHKLAKYILPPSASTISTPTINTEEARILISANLADASFNTAGLKYLIQIDGPSQPDGLDYVSRNYYVDASLGDGSLSFDSSGHIAGTGENIINNMRYDIAVVAFNATGSVAVSQHTDNILVSKNSNAPNVTNGILFNSASSDGRFTLTIDSDTPLTAVENDADRKYQIKVISVDTSNVEINTEIAAGQDVSGNFDNTSVTFDVSGLTANKEYIVEVRASNSTNVFSEPTLESSLLPQALPSGLKINEIRTGLEADQLSPSGKLLVRLDKDSFLPNGENVTIKYHVLEVDGTQQTNTVLQNIVTAPTASGEVVYISPPFYDINDVLIDNGFRIENLNNNKSHLVAVYAQNNSADANASDLSASWTGLTNANTVATFVINATNTPSPATHPEKPTFVEKSPLDGSNAIALGLNSGEIRARIRLPTNDLSGGNIPNYTSYRIFLEDVSGVDISGQTTGTDSVPFVSITQSDYLEMGKKFTHVDGSYVIVSENDSLKGINQYWVGGDVNGKSDPSFNDYVNDVSWSMSATDEIWLSDPSGLNQMRADASFGTTFTGLKDGDLHRVKAQVKIGSLESSILAEAQNLKPSSKPSLDSSLGSKVAGILKVAGNKTLLDNSGNVEFDVEGLNELLVGSTSGGYTIDSLLVAFVSSFTNVLGQEVFTINQQFDAQLDDAEVDASFTGIDPLSNEPAPLAAGVEYSVHVVPQNSIYDDISFSDFLTDLSGVSGKVVLDQIKLDSQILDVSGVVSYDVSGANNDEILITGQLVQGNGNTTAFVQIDGTLTSKPKKWDLTGFIAADSCYNHVETFTLVDASLGGVGGVVDASGFFTFSILVPKKRYGWENEVALEVLSRPKDDLLTTVRYSATPNGSTANSLQIGKKPTVILEDSSKVIVVPNGKTTTVELIDLSGNELKTADPFVPNGGDTNDGEAMNIRFNTFIDACNNLVAIDSDAVDDTTIPVMDLSGASAGIRNTFILDEANTLQASAFNVHGRTTLLSEKTFTITSLTGATLVASPNDGRFVLQPTTTGQISFKLDIA